MFQCFRTKTQHAAGKMNALGKGHVTFRMLSIKKRLLSRLFCTNNIKQSGKYSSDLMQNFAEKNEYRCVVQMHGLEHMRRFR